MQRLTFKRNAGAAFVYFVVILATFLLFGTLIWVTRQYTLPGAISADRAAERAKNLQELRATEASLMGEYGWQDQTKGIVRIPIDRAMELVLQEWQDPAQARTRLIERMKEATALPPPAPEAPSEFE